MQQSSREVSISKTLAWLLRHGALTEGLPIKPDGFIAVKDVLNHRGLKGKCALSDIEQIVVNDSKKRYTLRRNSNNGHEIKANQGHSISVDVELVPITQFNQVRNVIHGTFYDRWDDIKQKGLHRMGRNHIHFAPGTLREGCITMRANVDIYIYIDLERALKDGILFFQSSNNVVLSSGNGDGFIEPQYFLKVIDVKTGNAIG